MDELQTALAELAEFQLRMGDHADWLPQDEDQAYEVHKLRQVARLAFLKVEA